MINIRGVVVAAAVGDLGFVCLILGFGDVKSLDKLWSQTCLSALCIETVSKTHSCSAKAALKMF